MPTWRNFTRKTFRCGFYEAEDVLVEIDDVDLVPLDIGWAAWVDEYWLRTPIYHDLSRKLVFANPGLKKARLTRDYDIFIATFKTLWDLPYVNAIERWKAHCKVSICWIDELWVASIPDYRYWLPALRQFDLIFVGLKDTAPALSRAIDRPCHWLPGGVDAIRFSPVPHRPERVIDVYSIGRRYEGIHREMLGATERGELFYVHDTHRNAASMDVDDHRQHRSMFADMAKRSRYFMVAAAKMDAPDERQGQTELGHRYFEGAAAGAVLIGDAPDCESFRELFAWPDAVLPVRPDGSDIMAVIDDLGRDPARLAAIGRRNAQQALLQHDWTYRWKEMLRVAGFEPLARCATRERRLKEMADRAATEESDAATVRRRSWSY
jgi:Glycosyl transferases group 1